MVTYIYLLVKNFRESCRCLLPAAGIDYSARISLDWVLNMSLSRPALALLFWLLVLLPVQTVFVQFFVQRLGLPPVLGLWKEGAVFLLLLAMEVRIIRRRPKWRARVWQTQWPQIVAAALSIFALLSSLPQVTPTSLVAGYRFELWFVLVLGVTLSWLAVESPHLLRLVRRLSRRAIVWGFYPVLTVSAATLVFGERFLALLGFGTEGAGFVTTAPLVNVVDGGGWNNLARLSGGFSTPNHLAAYLLLILPVLIGLENKSRRRLLASANLALILFSYARFAWLGLLFFALAYLTTTGFWRRVYRGLYLIPLALALFAVLTPSLASLEFLPTFLRKPSSSTLHYRHTMASLEMIRRSPRLLVVGYGLGSSGPASSYFDLDDNPLHARFNDVAYRWTLFEPDLTIPENWYLQLLLNGGLPYTLLYLLLLAYPAYLLRNRPYYFAAYLALLLANLILHVFENQTVALYYTTLLLTVSWSQKPALSK